MQPSNQFGKPLLTFYSLVLLALIATHTASAATYVISDSDGQLLGATEIEVHGTLYDVTFVDGTCNAVFGNCANAENFIFLTGEDARDASAALIAQVFSANDEYDSDPTRTLGCEQDNLCYMLTLAKEQIPENGEAVFRLRVAATNYFSAQDFADGHGQAFAVQIDDQSSDTTSRGDRVWARWSIAESVIDSDNDGIPDDQDLCENTPEGEAVDANGCSASQFDSDSDGIPDDQDLCENTPDGQEVDDDGCSSSQRDTDSDGVSDAVDDCAETAAESVTDVRGCAISDYCRCDTARNHGQHRNCVSHVARDFYGNSLITKREESEYKRAAARSSCGK